MRNSIAIDALNHFSQRSEILLDGDKVHHVNATWPKRVTTRYLSLTTTTASLPTRTARFRFPFSGRLDFSLGRRRSRTAHGHLPSRNALTLTRFGQ